MVFQISSVTFKDCMLGPFRKLQSSCPAPKLLQDYSESPIYVFLNLFTLRTKYIVKEKKKKAHSLPLYHPMPRIFLRR